MIFRNQATDPNHLSLNLVQNNELKLNYKFHLSKILQIQNRRFDPKHSAKLIDKRVLQLTKLKQFARSWKQKEQFIERRKNDIIMIKKINQRSHTSVFDEESLTKTRSSFKMNSRVLSSVGSQKTFRKDDDKIKLENKRLIKCITENSFDQEKFRKTLKQTTKDYIKVRQHMRRLKNHKSLKKLKTEPQNSDIPRHILLPENNSQIDIQTNQSIQMQGLNSYFENNRSQNEQKRDLKQKSIKIRSSSKRILPIKQSLTQIIQKKLKTER